MPAANSIVLTIQLRRDNGVRLSRQIYEFIRRAVLSGHLRPGDRLPSSRQMSAALGCSRNNVIEAIEMLSAEGFVLPSLRSGVQVAAVHDPSFQPRGNDSATEMRREELSEAARQLLNHFAFETGRHSALSPNLPDTGLFPWATWCKLYRRVWRSPAAELQNLPEPAGYLPLRKAIASYLHDHRGLNCDPEQIVMTSGTTSSLDLLARFLVDPGDSVWLEDPTFVQAQTAFIARGARVTPVPVSVEGFSVERALALDARARVAVVTPSNQYPLGAVLSLGQRLRLLQWAQESNGWIIEDDHNSEFRYGGQPIAALQSLDESGRVFYLGTFAKNLLPNLRLSYIIAPARLAAPLARVRFHLDAFTSLHLQPVLASFIAEGYLAVHVNRMRKIYERRGSHFVRQMHEHFADVFEIAPATGGLHVVALLRADISSRVTDVSISDAAAAAGIFVRPLSRYFLGQPFAQGLVLGFSAIDEAGAAALLRRLNAIVDAVVRNPALGSD